MGSSMEVMSQLSDIFMRNKQLDKAVKIVNEMENLEQEFHSAYETVWERLDLLTFTHEVDVKESHQTCKDAFDM